MAKRSCTYASTFDKSTFYYVLHGVELKNSGEEGKTYGLGCKGSERDWAPSWQHEQGRWLLPELGIEASHMWLKKMVTVPHWSISPIQWALTMSVLLSLHCHHFPFLMPTWSLLIVPAQILPYSSQLTPSPEISSPTMLYIYGPLQFRLITSALKMEMALFSETLASTNKSTWWFNPKERNVIANVFIICSPGLTVWMNLFFGNVAVMTWDIRVSNVWVVSE
jgi:hypothetical protein